MRSFIDRFGNDIGVDLGTANTLVYLGGKGIVINEPSVVAVNTKTNSVVAVGKLAKDMLGKTPAHIKAVRPVLDGVISDFEVTAEMLGYHIKKANSFAAKILGPRVVVGCPSEITEVELKAIQDAATAAGARKVFIVEEPMAAAIGLGLPINESRGSMVFEAWGFGIYL
jgi:rod shape-determining protein MreB